MSEPSVEEIVAELEAVMEGLPPSQPDASAGLSDDEKRLVLKLHIARALIASWRARGEALERIVRWSEAYPLDIFPEPDLKRAHELLQAGGITLDAVSASAMRHVVEGVGEIARAALEDKP